MAITEIDKLDQSSGDPQRKAALSSCIATEIKNGKDQTQAAAICNSMIREKMGEPEPSPTIPQEGV